MDIGSQFPLTSVVAFCLVKCATEMKCDGCDFPQPPPPIRCLQVWSWRTESEGGGSEHETERLGQKFCSLVFSRSRYRWPGLDSRQRKGFSLHSVQTAPWAHPASYTMGTVGCFPGVKRQGREADRSPPNLHSPTHLHSFTFTYS
jgi:hypothetical protein